MLAVACRVILDYTLVAMANPDHLALAGRYAAGARNLRLEMLDLTGADLGGLDFSDAWLRDTKFCGANLQGCRFVGAPMPGTDLSGADLTSPIPRVPSGSGRPWSRPVFAPWTSMALTCRTQTSLGPT